MDEATASRLIPDLTLGYRLRIARTNARLTQAAMASRLNVSIPTVAYWEQDEKVPRDLPKVATIWSDMTLVDKHWLVFGEVRDDHVRSFSSRPGVKETSVDTPRTLRDRLIQPTVNNKHN